MSKILKLILLLSICYGFGQTPMENPVDFKGFFNFSYDVSGDKVFLMLKESDLNKEFLYVRALSEGLGSNDIGLDRGQLGGGVVVKWIKKGNKILLLQPNLDYRALSDNQDEKKSVEEAFAKSVLYGNKIEEKTSEGFKLDITDFLYRDAHGVANTLKKNDQGRYNLDKSRCVINLDRTKAFPKNVEFDVLLTFTGDPEGYQIRSVSPDASSITVFQHHSFVELPDANYQPRAFDPRSGSWDISYFDYATPIEENINKMFITRHRLNKVDPKAAISEAVEPIIYYVDRGAPAEIREALIEGASWWNQAFEAAGYKNGFQVKVLPEGADPLDLRYNVIQWVHRSTRGWSYGSSIVDPRTGEILKGHVSLGSLRVRQDFLIAKSLQPAYKTGKNDAFAKEMALARIRQLSAHEVGHTLGFAHNYIASTLDRASVMDYPHPWIKTKGNELDFSDAYATGIGVWDEVSVAYAYQDFVDDEEKGLEEILNGAMNKGLRFISDADSRPMGSAHPYSHLWDNGNDPVEELKNVLKVREIAISNFGLNSIQTGRPLTDLEDLFVPVYFYHRYQTEAVSKMIGGLDYSYSVKGGTQNMMKPLDRKVQNNALNELLKTIDIQEIAIPKKILELFPPRAMGYPRSRESFKSEIGLPFDSFGAVATAADMTLDLLFHPDRVSRLVVFAAQYPGSLTLEELIDSVLEKSFQADHKNAYHQELQQVVNSLVLEHLFEMASGTYPYLQVNAIASHRLNGLYEQLKSNKIKEIDKIYTEEYIRIIERFRKDPSKYAKMEVPKIPDGSPIGIQNNDILWK